VAQEALENVVQHAGAQQVRVKLEEYKGNLTLTVADDGGGFDTEREASEQQLGLQGMYERAELIGAKLEVTSAMEEGTLVRLRKENDSGSSVNM
jgi:signal transduction histidine kinase